LIRATRFATRFGWELEERTRARYDSAREGEYMQFLSSRGIGYELEQIAYEENPIAVMQALEDQGWLKVLCPKLTVAKANVPELAQLLKTRSTMAELNIGVDAAPAVMHFLTVKLGDAEVAGLQRLIPHREFVAAWKRLEDDAKDLSKTLLSKEAATNSGTWKILSSAKAEALLYLDVTGRNKTVDEKIKNFFGKWRQVQEKIPVVRMAELRITPQLPEYYRICQEAFLLLLDGKLRSDSEVMKFLAPYEPPPPPPPPVPVRRGRAAAKKISASAAKAAVPVPAAVAVAVSSESAATVPARDSKLASGSKPSSEKPGPSPVAAKTSEANARPAVAKKPPVTAQKPAAKPVKAPAKAPAKPATQGKAVVKTASKKIAKKAAKPAGKAGVPGRSATKSVKRAGARVAQKPAKKVLEKKMHGHKEHKPDKKHSKRH
jgi:tRNA nucleotidyltransferase (CCA-adding enzyme)